VNLFHALWLLQNEKGRNRVGLRRTEGRDNSTPDQA
jgi:hypothetical protein